jgi:hypothetical protein
MSTNIQSPHTDDRQRAIRLVIAWWAIGGALGAACALLLLWIDIAGLRHLLVGPERILWEAVVLLVGGFAVTFGGAVCAAAVMTVPASEGGPRGGSSAQRSSSVVCAAASRS